MVQTIKISQREKELINSLLSLTENEIYQKYGYKRDETITHTAKFQDGIEVDIKLVICEDGTPYTEGILFCNGYEEMSTEPMDTYNGEWKFQFANTEYTVIVKTED